MVAAKDTNGGGSARPSMAERARRGFSRGYNHPERHPWAVKIGRLIGYTIMGFALLAWLRLLWWLSGVTVEWVKGVVS